jgi:hypothetical protein
LGQRSLADTERAELRANVPDTLIGDPDVVQDDVDDVLAKPMCTVLIPAQGARLTRNGIEAEGRPWPRDREGRPSSTCVLGLCESWTAAS